MNNGTPRVYGAFIMVLVMLSVISIKMAFLYAAELRLLLLITIPGVITILYLEKNDDRDNEN
jgi:hypothetical protein